MIDQSWDAFALVAVDQNASKRDLAAAVPDQLRAALNRAVRDRAEGGDAVDLALFGRMLADERAKNQAAAVVAATTPSVSSVSVFWLPWWPLFLYSEYDPIATST